MRRLLICAFLLFAATSSVARGEPNLTPRVFYGHIGDRPIVMRLDFGTLISESILPKPLPPDFVNVHGEYFYLDEKWPLTNLLHGRWEKDARTLLLEEYRQEFDPGGEGATRKEQIGFFNGKFTELPEPTDSSRNTYQVSGEWMETTALSHYSFLRGKPFQAKQRAAFELNEGGKESIESLTGSFACSLQLSDGTHEIALEIEKDNVRSFTWKKPNCTIDQTTVVPLYRKNDVILTAKPAPNVSKCVASISSFGKRLLISVGPIFCACGGTVLLERGTNNCHNFLPRRKR